MQQSPPQETATMPPDGRQLRFSRPDTLLTLDRVLQALAAQGMPCRPGTYLDLLFRKTRDFCINAEALSDTDWAATFPKAAEGQRIAYAIDAALTDPGLRAAIKRVTTSAMDLSNPVRTAGKDALWELDLFRRLHLGGVGVRFAEPDLLVELEEGIEYSVACKKVNSPGALKQALRSGARQVRVSGRPGIVALNVDYLGPLTLSDVSDSRSLNARLQGIHQDIINANLRLFELAVADGRCDGILVSKAIAVTAPTMDPPRQLCWSNRLWTGSSLPSVTSRINAFARRLDLAPDAQRVVAD